MGILSCLKFWEGRITYEAGDDGKGSGSIVKYDVLFLLSYGWAMPFRGNVFTFDIAFGVVLGVGFATLLAHFKCPKNVPGTYCVPLPVGLSNISLVTVTSFLVGLFSNTLLQRWWALRMHLNGHTGGNNEVIILLSTIMANSKLVTENPERLQEAKQACNTLCRYLNVGNQLVIMNATKEFNYDKLLKRGLLNDSEYAMIKTMSGSPNIAYSWIDARLQKLANEGFLGPFPGSGQSNLLALLTAVGNARSNCIAVGVYVDTQLPYPFVQLVAFVVHACNIQVIFVAAGTIGSGFETMDYGLVFTGYLTLILFVGVMRSLLLLYNVLCNPLGDDAADFPWNTYLNGAEKGTFALMNNVFNISLSAAVDKRLTTKEDDTRNSNVTRLHFLPDAVVDTQPQTPATVAVAAATVN